MSNKAKGHLLEPFPKCPYGGFGGSSFITTGPTPALTDEYVKQEPIPSRYLGKNIMISAARSGNLPDVYFSRQYATLASSEQNAGKVDGYGDLAKMTMKEIATAKLKETKIHKGNKFLISSFPHKSTGPGSFFGCFQDKPFEYIADGDVKIATKKRSKKPAKGPKLLSQKPMYTAPGKKGTYGVPGTTLSEVNYLCVISDEMEAQRKKDVARYEKEKSKRDAKLKKLMDRPTFRRMGNTKKTFDEKTQTGISSIFDNYEAPPSKKSKKRKINKKGPKQLLLPYFKHSSPPKTGENGFLNSFPNTSMEINEDEENKRKKKQQRAARQKERENRKKKFKKINHPIWKPVSGDKSSCVSSLLTRFY